MHLSVVLPSKLSVLSVEAEKLHAMAQAASLAVLTGNVAEQQPEPDSEQDLELDLDSEQDLKLD